MKNIRRHKRKPRFPFRKIFTRDEQRMGRLFGSEEDKGRQS